MKKLFVATIALMPVAALAHGDHVHGAAASPVTAAIIQSGGAQAGTLTLTQGNTGVLLRIEANGLTPGWHAMHFHAVGDCSDAAFQKSGAHINHSDKKSAHGVLNPGGPDFGDLPNLFVPADGTIKAEAFSALVSLGKAGARADLLDADGSALVIHASADDHMTQPIGGAGARVACAVIKAGK